MKKKIIILLIILALLVGASFFLRYILSFKNIDFTLSSNTSSLAIFNSKNVEVENINSNQSIKLQTGNYVLIPEGNKISSDAINLLITKDEIINIDPDYSNSYLDSILESEKAEVQTILNSKYPNIINSYSIKNYQLFKKGDWCGGLLVNNNSSFNNKKDIFRFVAKKTNGVWDIINYPDLILTSENYPNIPRSVINTINSFKFDY